MLSRRTVSWRDRVLDAAVLVAAALCIVIWVRFGVSAELSIPAIVRFFLVRRHAGQYGYCCGHCGTKFEISAFVDFISPHAAQSKYSRCPRYGKRSWAEARATT